MSNFVEYRAPTDGSTVVNIEATATAMRTELPEGRVMEEAPDMADYHGESRPVCGSFFQWDLANKVPVALPLPPPPPPDLMTLFVADQITQGAYKPSDQVLQALNDKLKESGLPEVTVPGA